VATVGEEWDQALVRRRAELLRLCRRWTGDGDAAEDLVQETLYVAYRDADRLRNPDRREQWLAGIARHLCLHWLRTRQRERAHLAPLSAVVGECLEEDHRAFADPAADLDLDLELERAELVALLDRAMARLPAETRRVLLERYVEESPRAAIALQLGLSEGAVAMRLERGKLALRRLLSTELRAEAAAYGLVAPDADWQETRLWCACGTRRLRGRFSEAHTRLELRCPACFTAPNLVELDIRAPELLRDVKTFKRAYDRLLNHFAATSRVRPDGALPPCPRCGRATRLELRHWGQCPAPDIRLHCERCGWTFDCSFGAHLSTLPAVRAFQQQHPRMRFLPARSVEASGPALVAGFADVNSQASVEVVVAANNLAVLNIVSNAGG
jgi:RNA polymerase sigma-70 factor (ECF subfamily)